MINQHPDYCYCDPNKICSIASPWAWHYANILTSVELCGICSYNLKYIDEENNFLSNNQQFLLFEYLGFRKLKFIGLPSVDNNVM